MKNKYILLFDQISIKDVPLVGGKNASLGEMRQTMTKKGINVPDGFAITAEVFWEFLEKSNLKSKISNLLDSMDVRNINNLIKKSRQIQSLILEAEFPEDLRREIVAAYRKLSTNCKLPTTNYFSTAVRSSATAEDLPKASYAGQLESYLNISGEKQLLETIKKCFASLYGSRTISYSFDHKIDHKKIALSVGVQKMVRSDKASAGVIFTLDTESGFQDVVLINGAWGLGENVVKGRVVPDQFLVFKPTLAKGFRPIISKKLGSKKRKLIYTNNILKPTKNISTPLSEQKKFVLSDEEILKLSRWACEIERHYGKPCDIEWAKDGLTGQLFIVQSRPETIHKGEEVAEIEEYALKQEAQKPKVLCKGLAIGSKIGVGRAHIIKNVRQISQFKKGEILVTEITDPDWEPIMKIAAAIVTNSGGRTSHAAIVSRELGVPCVVGTANATEKIKNGKNVTVSCAEGEEGKIYEGALPYHVKKIKVKGMRRPKTKIMMNLAEPDKAFSLSFIPNDGVGLAREEFIINNYIKVHPRALLEFEKIKDKQVRRQIENLTQDYKNKSQFFVDKLAEGVAKIAAAFYPKEVILRFSDFKTNEYASLLGGKIFEPKEENPMMGWRGASRYYDPQFERAFSLECQAVKKVREEFGLDNLVVMVPFCRTPEEGKKVIKVIAKNGLKQGNAGLKIYVMCEIPSNVLLAEEFAKIFDGFSIGSNDLTQLILGVDRDSQLVAHIFDERNAAVKKMISDVIFTARKYGRKVGICGQAPSDFPDFAQFLVKCGIDSISLNPDTVIKTTLAVLEAEK